MNELRISPDLSLPIDAVTETFAIIAKRRVGKSNAAVVMAEQMYDAGIPWVAIDPKGDWWGVRSSGDGKGEGLAVPVFGGLHADVPLEPGAGGYMADLIAERRLTCVLDISQFNKAEEIRFLQPLAERLLKVNSQPLHMFFEECDDYIPQEKGTDELHVVRAFSRLIRHGGFKGIGSTLITQRAALVSKNVLAQTETLIVFRTTHPPDQKQVADWIKGHEASATVLPSLSSLPVGEAWVLSPGFLGTVEKITFSRRRTYDSGATPKVGERRTDPTRLADVDLAVIKEAMAETIERAKADDPKELRKRIAELERHRCPEPAAVEPERIDVPVLSDDHLRALRDGLVDLDVAAGNLSELADRITAALARVTAAPQQTPVTGRPSSRPQPTRTAPRARTVVAPTRPAAPTAAPAAERRPAGDGSLGLAETKLLTALVHRGPTLPRRSLGAIAGYSWKSGGFRNSLSSLRTKGFLDGSDPVTITDAGRTALGDAPALPTGRDLLNFWSARIGKAERAIAEVLYNAYPATLTREQVADACGYTVTSGGFRNALSRLRTLALVDPGDPLRASDELGSD